MREEVFEGLERQPAIYEAVQGNVQAQQDKVRSRAGMTTLKLGMWS